VLELGLENSIVGRTKFCIHPQQLVKSIPKIGGTKNPNISAILDLKPDLILANKEENNKSDIEVLMETCRVHLTDISNYKEALQSIKDIGQITDRQQESQKIILKIESRFSLLLDLISEKQKVCYLIWKDPMMTIGNDTYIHDMLQKCGFENIFGDQTRYPKIKFNEIIAKKPDFIFLSSEPFPFKEKHISEFQKIFSDAKIVLVDGEYFSWYGSRMALAADYFLELKRNLL
jgi:ABC-type Fe3+-hydroxamate transport system substrate-binding protein